MEYNYILNATNYAVPLKLVNTNQVISFLEINIIIRFDVPGSLVFENASYFSLVDLTQFSLDKGIKIKYSTNYYPQGNGLAEYTNKNLKKHSKNSYRKHS